VRRLRAALSRLSPGRQPSGTREQGSCRHGWCRRLGRPTAGRRRRLRRWGWSRRRRELSSPAPATMMSTQGQLRGCSQRGPQKGAALILVLDNTIYS